MLNADKLIISFAGQLIYKNFAWNINLYGAH